MKFEWIGSESPYLDEISVTEQNHVAIGCFGGSVSGGADKNEDGISSEKEKIILSCSRMAYLIRPMVTLRIVPSYIAIW